MGYAYGIRLLVRKITGSVRSLPGVRGGQDDTCVGGAMMFFPCANFFFSLLTRNKPFFISGKGQSIFFPHITPFFCQFCEQTVYFLQVAEQILFVTF